MKQLLFICLAFLSGSAFVGGQDVSNVNQHLWKPQKDDVYLQESAEKVKTEHPVQSVAMFENRCYALINQRICLLDGNKLNQLSNSPSGVNRILNEGNLLWAMADDGIYLLSGNNWKKIDSQKFVDLCVHLGAVYGATNEEIFRFDKDKFVSIKPEGGYYSSDITMVMEDGSQIHDEPVRLGPINRIKSYSGTLYLLRPGEVVLFDGKAVNGDFIDWGSLPSKHTTDMLSVGSRLFIGTDRGLGVLRGAAMTSLRGSDGLPVEQTTCLKKGFDDDLWIGTTRGAVRMTSNNWQYFGADHWLPGNTVSDIAVGDNVVYIATDAGLGIIHYEPFTLLKKAAYYERHLDEWGHKRLGFIHSLYMKNGEWVREVSDNDGGHTAPYLVAMCYKYAVTKDKTARSEAVEAFKAMLWLNRVTPVEGFIARSIWSTTADKDERSRQGSGGLPARWYPTKDGKWFWKGDTSSDEITAHFYAMSIFYDLVAEGKEKDLAREHLRRMASYIIDCGWTMHDLDGKPTRWARWNPEYLLRPYGYSDRGINGLESLAYMEAAIAATGETKFKKGYQQLINWGYPANTLRQKNVFPPADIAPWDDDLAFQSYFTLLRYASDPSLRSIYLRSLERTWEVKRGEHLPWFNFSYGVLTGNDCDLEKTVSAMREWVLDCVNYSYSNSHRDDLFIEHGYSSYEGGVKVLSPRETSVDHDNRRVTELDGNRAGQSVTAPADFVRDYWMGRYYGLIEAPATTDPGLISVKKRPGQKFGAEPYNGPARPEF
jgi:hypothetical protein